MKAKLNLFLLTARRIDLFRQTIETFVEKNLGSLEVINKVWILDDRSSWGERIEMTDICKSLFGDKVHLVTFDSERDFGWIDKFNFIGKASDTDFSFLLEDDWKCLENLNLESHIEFMEASPEITQIAFCDPLFVQEEVLIELNENSEKYWKNPWPGEFRHVGGRVEGGWKWQYVRMNHYTNNPAITRSSVFKNQQYVYDRSFEHLFADQQPNPLQFFTKELLFEHIGTEEALDKTK
jgi:hypothetical protein